MILEPITTCGEGSGFTTSRGLCESTTEEQQETDDRQARAQILGDLDYQRSHDGLDTRLDGDE